MSDTEKFFEDARTMFMTDGWTDFMTDVQGVADSITLDNANSVEEFWMSKGKLAALRVILTYEDTVRAAETLDEDSD
jgi:hypothetical protein